MLHLEAAGNLPFEKEGRGYVFGSTRSHNLTLVPLLTPPGVSSWPWALAAGWHSLQGLIQSIFRAREASELDPGSRSQRQRLSPCGWRRTGSGRGTFRPWSFSAPRRKPAVLCGGERLWGHRRLDQHPPGKEALVRREACPPGSSSFAFQMQMNTNVLAERS